jgi:nucleosome binding factor SPN SPT16 subunit
LALQQDLLTKIKDGISAREAYQAALTFVKEKNPELEKNFQKNIGFGVGRLDRCCLATDTLDADWCRIS